MKSISQLLDIARKYNQELPPLPCAPVLNPPLSKYLDCAVHDPAATPERIIQLCEDAKAYHYATVFVNPLFTTLVKETLGDSGVHTGTIAGFPLGAFPTEIKVTEAKKYLDMGADEIDMVMNVGMLKAGEYDFILEEVHQMAETVHAQGGLMKVILETCLLEKEEKIISCLICKEAGANFVKTSTGFSKSGATIEDIDLMRRVVGPQSVMGVKAAGGVHTLAETLALIEAGANRLGTRMAKEILEEAKQAGIE
ncbi:MAG: deoxyribose-phosphate aldolase [Anaerolineaceae bacterium]|nr:deoxyribose-phosphate aldolase [Anaerolineaceae bacterium]